MRDEFKTTDPHGAWNYLSEAYGVDVKLIGDPGLVRVVRNDLGLLLVDEVEHHVGLAGPAVPNTYLQVVEGRRGWADISRDGGTDRSVRGSVVALSQPGEQWAVSTGPMVQERVVSLDEGALRQAVRDRSDGDGDGAVTFSRLTPRVGAAGAPWRSLVDFVARTVAADSAVLHHELALSSLTQVAAHTALSVFANDTWDEPTQSQLARDSVDGCSGPVVRAVGFIETSAHTDISISDIAAAAHVTPRALQYGFRRRLDTTPMAYLRKVRLHHARAQLLGADPDTTVAEVAGRWGFFNLGRFASYYRSEFGENPAQTLAGSTGQPSSANASA